MSHAAASTPASRTPRPLSALTPRAQIAAMVAAIAALHLVGWGGLALTLAQPGVSGVHVGGVLTVGLAATAYTLGMRHAFDADHIAAIDNTVRKLTNDGQRPLTVGFWFSLGHSTVVFLAALAIAFGVGSLSNELGDDSPLRSTLGLVGTLVSGVFLIVIAVVNALALARLVRAKRRGDAALVGADDALSGGVLTRLVRPALSGLRRPRQMYGIGFLFGLGFDTATEIALLAVAASAGASGLPWYSIMLLPVLFAAGMSSLDAADGALMAYAYRWSQDDPERRLTYNLVVTALSVTVAVVVGGIELAGLLGEKAGVQAGPLAALGELDLTGVGFATVAVLLGAWLVAALGSRLRGTAAAR